MSRYQITAPDGRTAVVEGDRPPTEADARDIFGGTQDTGPSFVPDPVYGMDIPKPPRPPTMAQAPTAAQPAPSSAIPDQEPKPGQYTINAPDGRSVTVEGDHVPTEAEAAQILASLPPKKAESVIAPKGWLPDFPHRPLTDLDYMEGRRQVLGMSQAAKQDENAPPELKGLPAGSVPTRAEIAANSAKRAEVMGTVISELLSNTNANPLLRGPPPKLTRMLLTKGGMPVDMALSVGLPLAGATLGSMAEPGAGTALGGAAGSELANSLVQTRMLARGETNRFSPGSLIANTAIGAIVPGPTEMAATPALTIGKRLLTRTVQGAALNAGGSIGQQWLDNGKVDLTQAFEAGKWGALFGSTFGALESTPQLAKWARGLSDDLHGKTPAEATTVLDTAETAAKDEPVKLQAISEARRQLLSSDFDRAKNELLQNELTDAMKKGQAAGPEQINLTGTPEQQRLVRMEFRPGEQARERSRLLAKIPPAAPEPTVGIAPHVELSPQAEQVARAAGEELPPIVPQPGRPPILAQTSPSPKAVPVSGEAKAPNVAALEPVAEAAAEPAAIKPLAAEPVQKPSTIQTKEIDFENDALDKAISGAKATGEFEGVSLVELQARKRLLNENPALYFTRQSIDFRKQVVAAKLAGQEPDKNLAAVADAYDEAASHFVPPEGEPKPVDIPEKELDAVSKEIYEMPYSELDAEGQNAVHFEAEARREGAIEANLRAEGKIPGPEENRLPLAKAAPAPREGLLAADEVPFNLVGDQQKGAPSMDELQANREAVVANENAQREMNLSPDEIDKAVILPKGERPPLEPPIVDVPLVRRNPTGGYAMARVVTTLGGGAAGSTYGFATGKTPEEKIKRGLEFGALGLLAGHFIPKLGEQMLKDFPRGSQRFWSGMENESRVLTKQLAGRTLPRTSTASEDSANAMVHYASADIASPYVAADLAAEVLGDHYKDPEFAKRLGTVMVEDRLRAIRNAFASRARQLAENPKNFENETAAKAALNESQRYQQMAQDVESTIGKEWSPLKTEKDFLDALADPEIKAAIERHKQIVQPQAEAQHQITQGQMAAKGPNTGAFVNLKAILGDADEAAMGETGELAGFRQGDVIRAPDRMNYGRVIGRDGDNLLVRFINPETGKTAELAFDPVGVTKVSPDAVAAAEKAGEKIPDFSSRGTRRGDITNPLQRKSVFRQSATGTAEEYVTDYNEIVQRMIQGNYAEAAKREMYAQLQKDGLAAIVPAGGKAPDFGGVGAEKFPIESRARGEPPANIYVRRDLAGEFRNVLDVDGSLRSTALARIAGILNKVQLTGLTDPVYHVANIMAAISGSPGGKDMLADLARQYPGVNVMNAARLVFAKAKQVTADTPEIRRALANIAEVGAARSGHPGMVSAIDKAGRLVLNDMYENLVKRGLVENTTTNRREFINQVGQYNPRLMGHMGRFLKEAGWAPFIVAGRNFNRLAIQRLLQLPAIKGADRAAYARLIGQNIAGTVSSLATVATINYLISHRLTGPEGTAFGAIGWIDRDGKLQQIDPQKWTLMRRGMRETGVNAVVNGIMQDKGWDRITGEGIRDMINAQLHPVVGPVPSAAYAAVTGQSPSGYPVAQSINPRAKFPTGSQYRNNLVAAAEELNPMVGAAVEAKRRDQRPLAGLLTSLGGAVGYRQGQPFTAERGRAEATLETQQRRVTDLGQKAQDEYKRLAAMPVEQRGAEVQKIARANPDLMPRLAQEIYYQAKGFTPAERAINQLAVEHGDRAHFIFNELEKMPLSERGPYLKNLADKRIFTDKVAEQLMALAGQRQAVGQ